jgi:hypothetical protein
VNGSETKNPNRNGRDVNKIGDRQEGDAEDVEPEAGQWQNEDERGHEILELIREDVIIEPRRKTARVRRN